MKEAPLRPRVTTEMEEAGMKEWDRRMKARKCHWPEMLAAVYRAMYAVRPGQRKSKP